MMASAELVQSAESPDLPHCIGAVVCCFPGAPSGSWIGKGAAGLKTTLTWDVSTTSRGLACPLKISFVPRLYPSLNLLIAVGLFIIYILNLIHADCNLLRAILLLSNMHLISFISCHDLIVYSVLALYYIPLYRYMQFLCSLTY